MSPCLTELSYHRAHRAHKDGLRVLAVGVLRWSQWGSQPQEESSVVSAFSVVKEARAVFEATAG
jgi:hypothetical protein